MPSGAGVRRRKADGSNASSALTGRLLRDERRHRFELVYPRALCARSECLGRGRDASERDLAWEYCGTPPATSSGGQRCNSEPATTRAPRAERRTDETLDHKLDPSDGWCCIAQGTKTSLFAGLLRSGRQDLNLRPPGPQPERSGGAQPMKPVPLDSSAYELCAVALNLFPKLFPGVGLPGPPGRDQTTASGGKGRPTRARPRFSLIVQSDNPRPASPHACFAGNAGVNAVRERSAPVPAHWGLVAPRTAFEAERSSPCGSMTSAASSGVTSG